MRLRTLGALWLALAATLAACASGTSATTPPGATPTNTSSSPAILTTYAYATDTHLAPLPVSWPMFDFDSQHSGVNPNEQTLSTATVGGLHRLWSVKLPAVADSTPILAGDVHFPDGRHGAVLYMTTKTGALVAADALTGAVLWAATPAGPRFTTASPALDPAGTFVYSYGLDGFVHKIDAATGREITSGGWPVQITRLPDVEKGSSALTIAGGWLYVVTSGYPGDAGHYDGHIVGIPLAGGAPVVWNALCSNLAVLFGPNPSAGYCADDQAGIWARAGVVLDPATGHLLAVTGNGQYTADQGGHDYGDTVLALTPDLKTLVDSYTPTVYPELLHSDLDLGSTAPALLPAISGAGVPLLAVQAGKDGHLRLLNRQNLSGQGGPNHVGGEVATISAPGGCQVFTQPAVWTDHSGQVWVFVTNDCGTSGYQVATDANGATTLREAWHNGQVATSPVIAGGVLFAATSNHLFAFDPLTGNELWRSTQNSAGGNIGAIHWESPIVVAGRVYITDESGMLTAYGL